VTDLLPGKILDAIQSDCRLKEIEVEECIKENGRIHYRGTLFVPESDVMHLCFIQEHYNTVLAGYPGQANTLDLLGRRYYWKEMGSDVDQYIRNCHSCQWFKSLFHSILRVLQPLPDPNVPWQGISIDFVVELPECNGLDAIWEAVDRVLEMWQFIPCHTTIDATGLAELLQGQVIYLQGSIIDQLFRIGNPSYIELSWHHCTIEGDWMEHVNRFASTDVQSNRTDEC